MRRPAVRSFMRSSLQPILRPILQRILPLCIAILVTGCAAISGPRDVTVPIEKLQASLAGRFPFHQRYLEVLDVTATNPRLTLQPETNRVVATVDAVIAPLFLRRTFTGTFVLSGMLAIDPGRNAVVLREPRMENLTLDGLDANLASQLAKISGALAKSAVGDVPLYNFDPGQFRYAGVQFMPTKIVTTPRALVVTFEPVK